MSGPVKTTPGVAPWRVPTPSVADRASSSQIGTRDQPALWSITGTALLLRPAGPSPEGRGRCVFPALTAKTCYNPAPASTDNFQSDIKKGLKLWPFHRGTCGEE